MCVQEAGQKSAHNSPSLVYLEKDETRQLPSSLAPILFYHLIRLDLMQHYKAKKYIIMFLIL